LLSEKLQFNWLRKERHAPYRNQWAINLKGMPGSTGSHRVSAGKNRSMDKKKTLKHTSIGRKSCSNIDPALVGIEFSNEKNNTKVVLYPLDSSSGWRIHWRKVSVGRVGQVIR
jgi:hypothetical protein